MYRKKTGGWLRHLDFIALDLGSLVLAFVAAYFTRHGTMPFGNQAYVNLILVLLLLDFAVLVITETMKNVLHRGY